MEERVVTFDGGNYIKLMTGDRIIVKRSDRQAKLLRTGSHNFLQILRNKL